MKILKLGVIGLGSIAKPMLSLCKITPCIRVTSLCDIDDNILNKYKEKFKTAQTYKDYRKLLTESDCDAVYIALPHFLHYPAIMEAIKNNKHILCEKPLTISLAEGLEIEAFSRVKNIKIAVNYQYRYDNNFHTAIEAIRQNDIGKVNYVRCYVPWSRSDTYFEKAPWHKSLSKSGGGTLITHGSHFLDIILKALDDSIEKVNSFCGNLKFKNMETEDFCGFQAVLKKGTFLHFASNVTEAKERAARIEFVGEKGTIILKSSFFSNIRFYGIKKRKLKTDVFGLHPAHRSLRAFADWVLSDKKHLCDNFESLKVIEAIEKIYKESEIL